MKRLLLSNIIFLCSIMAFAQFTGTKSDEQGVRYTSNEDGTTCYVSGHEEKYNAVIVIPESFEGLNVTSIGQYAFHKCPNLRSLTIPNSVTSIGWSAFEDCSGLTSVTIPNSVTSIGERAFMSCSSLTSVAIPNSVTSIGYSTFLGCSGLTSVTIPNSVTSIGEGAFINCSGLTSVTIPNSVTSIGEQAFCGCSALTSVTIPNSVTDIGYGAFMSCSSLTSVAIPNRVIRVGSCAFQNCSGLTSVTIPNSVTGIGEQAFFGCSALTSVTIGNSVTSIGYSTFRDCSSLTSVTIGNSVTSIGNYAFNDCSGLTSVTIPNSVTSIGNYAFSGCSALTSVTIGNSVTSIGRDAFTCCHALTAVNINDLSAWCSIDYVYSYPACVHLDQIEVAQPSNPLFYAHHLFLNGQEVTDLVIPNSVIKIKDYAFSGCSGLTSVTIPESVTSIGGGAFVGCSGLTSVHISNLDVWYNISFGGNPFSNAHHLYLNGEEVKDLVIPNSVTSIGNYAFSYCSGLTSVTIPNSVTSIGDRAFEGCSGLTEVTIPNSVTSINYGAFQTCTGLTSVTIPNSVTSIGGYAFNGCSGLISVSIPNSVTSFGERPFYGCKGTLTVNCNIPDPSSLHWSFLAGSSFSRVIIGNGVTSIGSYAFNDCSGLTSITIPNSVTSIGNYAFDGCSGLTEIISLIEEPFNIFFYKAYDATLYVPVGTKEKYEATAAWNKFKNIVERGIAPDDNGDVNYGGDGDVNDDTDMSGTVVGNVFYSIADGNGSYSSTEGCIVVRKPTTDEQVSEVEGTDLFGEQMKDNFTGIIFKIEPGSGTVKVTAETTGDMTLKIKIGKGTPMEFKLNSKMEAKLPYTVDAPTYVYVYAGSGEAAGAKGMKKAAGDGELKIYRISWGDGTDGIEAIDNGQLTIDNSPVYNLNGQKVDGMPTKKGVYIKDGKKVLVK